MELEETKDALSLETAAWLVQIFEEELPIEELAPLSEDVSGKLRALAITALLTDANINLYCHHLIRSARVRVHFLDQCLKKNELNEIRRASSRNEPLFDAIAVKDIGLARRIASLSPEQWFSNVEYEEDYAYTQIIQRILPDNQLNAESVQNLMDQFERVLEGNSSARFDLCIALLKKDQDIFDEAFEDLITERDSQVSNEKSRWLMIDSVTLANQYLFIEGVAILQLAETLGLQTKQEYRYCPAMARFPMTKPFPGK
jgi:hypothetical protein